MAIQELVEVAYSWKDEPEKSYNGTIAIGTYDETTEGDEKIFFYAWDKAEFEKLKTQNNGEDFIIREQDN
jgi:hypothetical protein